MKVMLNITFHGVSADYPLDFDGVPTDRDVRRIAIEVVRAGSIPGLQVGGLEESAFDGYVVDRFHTPEGGHRLFLRPKVPFGAGA